MQPTPARSPTLNSVTEGPTSTTTPTISCPAPQGNPVCMHLSRCRSISGHGGSHLHHHTQKLVPCTYRGGRGHRQWARAGQGPMQAEASRGKAQGSNMACMYRKNRLGWCTCGSLVSAEQRHRAAGLGLEPVQGRNGELGRQGLSNDPTWGHWLTLAVEAEMYVKCRQCGMGQRSTMRSRPSTPFEVFRGCSVRQAVLHYAQWRQPCCS
jgi:hypothetical protein